MNSIETNKIFTSLKTMGVSGRDLYFSIHNLNFNKKSQPLTSNEQQIINLLIIDCDDKIVENLFTNVQVKLNPIEFALYNAIKKTKSNTKAHKLKKIFKKVNLYAYEKIFE